MARTQRDSSRRSGFCRSGVVHTVSMTDTAAALQRRRLEKHLSIRALSGLAGVAVGTIRRIEAGEVEPFGHTVAKLADALDLDPLTLAPVAVDPDEVSA